MLLLSLLSCVLDPSPGLFARFEAAPPLGGANVLAGSVTQLADETWLYVDGAELVTLRGEAETRHSNVTISYADSLRATGPNSAVALTAAGVAHTSDTGASFAEVALPPLENVGAPRGVLPLHNNRVVVGPENVASGLFWLSEDGGASFTTVQFPVADETIIEVRSTGSHLAVETVTEAGTHLYRWNPASRSADRVHTNEDNTRHRLPSIATSRGTMIVGEAHPWRVDGLAPISWTRDLQHLDRPWEWGAIHSGGHGDNTALIGLTHDDRVLLGGYELRVSALPLDDPRSQPDLFAGPLCNQRYRLQVSEELDAPALSTVSITNNTEGNLVPIWIQVRGTWSQRWGDAVPPGETVVHQGPYSGDQSWFLMLEGLEDGRCYGVFEIDDAGPSAITAESRG